MLRRTLLLALSFTVASVLLQAAERITYAAQLARARQFAAEKSWALARDAFIAAQTLAPDETSRRWCELWSADAAWRSEPPPPNSWPRDWINRNRARLDALLETYGPQRERDDIWIAAKRSRAELRSLDWNQETESNDWRDLLDHLSAQPPSPGTAAAHLEVLKAALRPNPRRVAQGRPESWLIEHLRVAARATREPQERAWALLQLARAEVGSAPESLATRAQAWAAALAASANTNWAGPVAAEEFAFRASTGWKPGAAPDSPADFPALLAELETHRTALASASPETQSPALLKQLDTLRTQWTAPLIGVAMHTHALPSVTPRLRYVSVAHDRLRIEVYRHTLMSWMQRPDDVRALLFHGIVPDAQKPQKAYTPPSGAERVHEQIVPLDGAARLAWSSEFVDLPAFPPGFYSVVLTGENSTSRTTRVHDFVVSGAKATLAIAADAPGAIFAHEAATGSPISHARFRAHWKHPGGSGQVGATTDENGRVNLPAWSAGPQGFAHVAFAGFVGDHPLHTNALVAGTRKEPLIAELLFDRPLYRPGDTVRWKLIVRERKAGAFTVPAEKLKLSIGLNDVALVNNLEVKLNAFGTTHGQFEIPKHASTGYASAQLHYTGRSNEESQVDMPFSFRVDNFVPPALSADLQVTSGANSMRPNREVTFRLRVRYFSGGPAASVPVACRFETQAQAPREGWRNYALGHWIQKLKEDTRQAVTDDAGIAEFRLRMPGELTDDLSFTAYATAMPVGGQAVETSSAVTVTKTGLRMQTPYDSKPIPARPNERVEFTASIVDGTGKRAAFEGTAELVRRRWVEIWLDPAGRLVSSKDLRAARQQLSIAAGRALPAPWRQLHREYVDTVVARTDARCSLDGEVRVPFVLPEAGLYHLNLKRNDLALPLASGGKAPAVLAIGNSLAEHDLPSHYSIVLGTRSHRPGTALDLLVVVPEGVSSAILSVAGESSAVTKRINLSSRTAWISVADVPVAVGEVHIGLLGVPAADQSRGASCIIPVEESSSHLQLAVAPEAEAAAPGSQHRVNVTVRDTNGTSVASQVAVFASDEAEYRLADLYREPPEPEFHRYSSALPSVLQNQVNSSPAGDLEPLGDTRPGALLNPTRRMGVGPNLEYRMPLYTLNSRDENGRYAGLAGRSMSAAPGDAGSLAGERAGPIILRRRFSATACWAPEITTDSAGRAQVSVTYPDNLTEWRWTAYAVSADGKRFGRTLAFSRTELPFQARLLAPRSVVAGDTIELGGEFVNRTSAPVQAVGELKATGAVAVTSSSAGQTGSIPPQQQARLPWQARAAAPGAGLIELSARAGKDSDGMQIELPVLENGIQQNLAASGQLPPSAKRLTLNLALPSQIDPQRTHTRLMVSPSHAATLLDALPYLIHFPYGCVEQTMSRFLPAIVTRKVLRDLGFEAAQIEQRMLAYPRDTGGQRERRSASFSQLDEVIADSLSRLAAARATDDGFGWWPGQSRGDPWMTAYVAFGLALAREAGVSVPEHLPPDRELRRLCEAMPPDDDNVPWMLVALLKLSPGDLKFLQSVFATAFGRRDGYSPSARALLAYASATLGTPEQRTVLLRNLDNGARRVRAPDLGDTVHWGTSTGYWRASDGAVESTALTLLALLELDGKHPLIDPAINWLVLNRRSAHWQSTRETAFAALALARTMSLRGEASPQGEIEVLANGRSVQRVQFSRESVVAGPMEIAIEPKALRAGNNRFEVRRISGSGPVYLVASASAWAHGDTIKPASHLISTVREFVALKPQPTLAGTVRFSAVPLIAQQTVSAGEEIQVILSLDAPNELEYVKVEVPRPAGCEPLAPLSGWDARLVSRDAHRPAAAAKRSAAGRDEGSAIYREEHDDRSVFFLSRIPAGKSEIRYRIRATTAGDFQALPVTVEAMYAPEVRANSAARRLQISAGIAQAGASQ